MLSKETHDLIQQLHADGMPKLRIANQLNLTFHTVNKHVKNPEWKPYKRANVVPGNNDNKREGPTVEEYEARMMKSRTGI